MSRAFVKEDGSETPPIVRQRAPLPSGAPNLVTPRGCKKLQLEHESLSTLISSEPDPARQNALRQELADLTWRLMNAQVVDLHRDPPREIRFGATVQLKTATSRSPLQVTLVGADEADPAKNLISIHAPFAKALLGKRPGQPATVHTEEGEDLEMNILSIRYEAGDAAASHPAVE